MQAYTGFAAVYDTFMDNIPYEEWCEYLTGLLKEQGVTEGLLLDLGCGTGSLTELLADAGYDMIGVDNSEEMLELALEKKEQSGKDILYLCQDMREFELYGTVAASSFPPTLSAPSARWTASCLPMRWTSSGTGWTTPAATSLTSWASTVPTSSSC